MSESSYSCPTCGRLIPPEVSSGICPSCALEIAMDEDGGPRADSEQPSDLAITHLEPSPARLQSGATGSPPTPVLPAYVSFYGRYLLIALFVAATGYVLTRMIWDLRHTRPSLKFDSDLHLAFDLTEYGRTEEDTLVEVNGIQVSDLRDLGPAYDAGSRDRVHFLFRTLDGEAPVEWVPFNAILEYTVTDAGELIPEDGSRFPDLELSPVEVVSAINGTSLSDIDGPVTEGRFNKRYVGLRTRFTVIANDTGATRDVVVHKYDRGSYWSRFFVGFVFGALGITGFWLRPRSRVARAFLFFCAFFAITWYSRAIPFYVRTGPENLVYHLLQCFLPVPCMLFIVTFTPMRAVVRRPWLWLSSSGVIGFALIVANLVWDPNMAKFGLLHVQLYRIWTVIILGLVLLCLSGRAVAYVARRPISPTDRQRNLVLWFAVLLGFLPASVYNLILSSSGIQFAYRLPVESIVLVFPIVVLYAILRHNLLNLNELAREGLVYGLLLLGITLGYSGLASMLTPLSDAFLGSEEVWLRTALMAGAFMLAIPVHTRARRGLDRRFNRLPLEYDTVIDSLGSLSSKDDSPLEYCQMVVHQLQRVTRATSAAVFTNFEEYGGWTSVAVAPTPRTGHTTERCLPLLMHLEGKRAVVFREDILEDSTLGSLREDILDGFSALQCEVVYPLIAFGRIVGALALGEKDTHQNYRGAEIKSLIRITTHVAQHVSNLLGRITAMQGRRIADIFPRYPDYIGRYTIREVIGEGGMAYVYLGFDDASEVAIKVPNLQVQGNPQLMERFRREASAMQRLNHPNIVQALDVSWHDQEPYIVMEYLAGSSVDKILKATGPLSERDALDVVLQAAFGLKAALGAGIVHRDVKPRNLFRTSEGTIKVGDFGLAYDWEQTPLTVSGELFGTPEYMSPEMARGSRTDWRADQYALGITLYELLAGTRPFRGEKHDAIIYQHIHEPVPDIRGRRRKDVRQAVSRIFRRMLEKDPEDRYPSYESLIEALESTLDEFNDVQGHAKIL